MIIKLPQPKLSGIITVHKGKDPNKMSLISAFPNMILDSGLRYFGTSTAYMDYCNIGSSGAAVNPTQTKLITKLYHSNTNQDSGNGANNDNPLEPYVFNKRTVRFPPKGVDYNVAEVGFGWDTSGNCFNRALVLDIGGLPTVLSIQSDEYLDVTYELRVYPPMGDSSGTVTPSGLDTVPRSWVARASSDGGVLKVGSSNTHGWSASGDFINNASSNVTINSASYRSGMTEIFTMPTNKTGNASTCSALISPSGASATITTKFTLNDSNHVDGIKTIMRKTVGVQFMIEFSAPFLKKNTDDLTISFLLSWGRK